MPGNLSVLNYLVKEENTGIICPGQLVKIPLRGSEEFGVVKKIIRGDVQDKQLKYVLEIVNPEPFILGPQMLWLEEMSEFYKTSLGFLLKNSLLPLQKRKLKNLAGAHPGGASGDKRKYEKPVLLLYGTAEEKKTKIISSIPKEGQVLILAPEMADARKIMDFLPREIMAETDYVASSASPKQMFDAWLRVWQGKTRVVVGTRRALFLPFHDLGAIIIDDESNPNHKSFDASPRFHVRDAAIFLSRQHQASLVLLAHTPAVETYFFVKNKIYSGEKKPPVLPLPEIINLKDEYRSGNNSFLAEALKEEIFQIKDGDCFLFLNRLGTANYVSCADCEYVFSCPVCDKPLSFYEKSKKIICARCRKEENMPGACPKCGGYNLKFWGRGTAGVEEELRKMAKNHKNSPRIIRLDSEEKQNLEKIRGEENKIIIGTQKAWPHLNWGRIKMAVFLDPDLIFFVPEFRMAESLFTAIRDASFRVSPGASLFVQTKKPEHRVFASLFSPAKFYEDELQERKKLNYPPYSFLVRLLYGHTEEKAARENARRVLKNLSDLTPNDFTGKISGPFETTPFRDKGRYWQIILAKIPYSSYKKDTRWLAKNTPPDWKIDPNPNNILTF